MEVYVCKTIGYKSCELSTESLNLKETRNVVEMLKSTTKIYFVHT